jgi:hypothetical protein
MPWSVKFIYRANIKHVSLGHVGGLFGKEIFEEGKE